VTEINEETENFSIQTWAEIERKNKGKYVKTKEKKSNE
jgi:hypothetical protein